MSTLVDGLSWACLIGGAFFCITGAIGMLRMPDFYTRMHAASVTDTLGVILILGGLALQSGTVLVVAKLAMIGMLVFFTSPASTHALAKAALARGLAPHLSTGEAPSKPS